jgi:RNA polymerase sigma factor (sigma-70 family)
MQGPCPHRTPGPDSFPCNESRRGGVLSGVSEFDCVDPVRKALLDDLDEGFEQMYGAYRGLVFSTALRLSGRWADAEDLTAEAFLRAYRALAGYERERLAALQPRAWLMTILMNVWRNCARAKSRKPPPDLREEPVDEPDPTQDVEGAAVRRETGDELSELLGLLPEEQRAAVVLRHVVDLPVSEIAIVLKIPQGTVKSHVSRGLRRLRALGGAR